MWAVHCFLGRDLNTGHVRSSTACRLLRDLKTTTAALWTVARKELFGGSV